MVTRVFVMTITSVTRLMTLLWSWVGGRLSWLEEAHTCWCCCSHTVQSSRWSNCDQGRHWSIIDYNKHVRFTNNVESKLTKLLPHEERHHSKNYYTHVYIAHIRTTKTIMSARQQIQWRIIQMLNAWQRGKFTGQRSTQLVVLHQSISDKTITNVVRFVLSYKSVNCCNIANSVGMAPLKLFWCNNLLKKKASNKLCQGEQHFLQSFQLLQVTQLNWNGSAQRVGGQRSVDKQCSWSNTTQILQNRS